MIHSILIFNNVGKARLTKFYSDYIPPASRASVVDRTFNLIRSRPESLCNFVDAPFDDETGFFHPDSKAKTNNKDAEPLKIVYRCYATLYFVFIVDSAESELGILDLIQVFVESLDRCFENVCELDLIFHFDDVHMLLSCVIVGGVVLDTSIDSIASNYRSQKKAAKSSANTNSLSETPWDKFSFNALRSR